MKKPLIIGQAPGPHGSVAPLSGRCGERLAGLCGLDMLAFGLAFERVNLIDAFPGKDGKGDAFPIEVARERAVSLLLNGRLFNRKVVMLGAGVARAFGIRSFTFLEWAQNEALALAIAPHPSGVSRWWNVPENVKAAEQFWRSLARGPSRK